MRFPNSIGRFVRNEGTFASRGELSLQVPYIVAIIRKRRSPGPRFLVGILLSAVGVCLLAWAGWKGATGSWQERRDRALATQSVALGRKSVSDGPDALAVLRLDRLGWSVTVRKTAQSRDLARGAGWIAGTAAPGEAGNIGIAGHRDTFFRALAHVQLGDEISLSSLGTQTRYRVTRTLIVAPNETGVLESSSTPMLTLVTCYPFYFVGPAPKRFVVRAESQPAR